MAKLPTAQGLLMPHPDVVSVFAAHFVSLVWIDRTPLTPEQERELDPVRVKGIGGRVQEVSGFLLSVSDRLFLVTAGHILKDLADAKARGQVLEKFQLHDAWSAESTFNHPIPFAFDIADKGHVCDETLGWDYGIIELNDLIRDALAANGKVPLDEQAWLVDLPTEFDGYFLIGLPTDLIDRTAAGDGYWHRSLALSPILRLSEPPLEELKTDSPRFYGWVKTPIIPDGEETNTDLYIHHLDGFSGSPIVGMKIIPGKDGASQQVRYWVVALQSAWHAETQTLIGCPLLMLGVRLAQFLQMHPK
jgi:hypothetical protein